MKNRIVFSINVLAAALIAVLVKQVGHESFHGLTAEAIGADWTKLNLFFAEHAWQGNASPVGDVVIAAGAALFNILLCFVFAGLFNNRIALQNPTLRLFIFFLTAYNLFAGFGYLFTDPLFFQPGGENLGDWKKVVDFLGGGWNARLPISLAGAAGVLWGFFWVGRNAHAFLPSEQPERFRMAILMLLLPYLVVSGMFTALGASGSLPAEIVPIVAIQYFFGYFGIGWGAFMAGKWLGPKSGLQRTPIPDSLQTAWVAAAVILFVVVVVVLVPTLEFT